jgi:NAD-reducing hydrogenase large subunit
MEHAKFALDLLKKYQQDHLQEVEDFACFDSNFMGLVQPDGSLEHYDGKLRFADHNGKILEDQIDPANYLEVIAEASEPWSYLKFPFIKRLGYPQGMYRVGPLGRLNIADRISTPQANKELQEWRSQGRTPRRSSFYYHWARLIETVYALESIGQLLEDPEICSTDVLVTADPKNEQGVGVIEAPRGTLFHHYWVDESGRIEQVNLIVATGHNNLAMNRAVQAVAQKYVKAQQLQEGMLNRVEAAIRCYDPCLSCSTHAVGQMPMIVELVDAGGKVVDILRRGDR